MQQTGNRDFPAGHLLNAQRGCQADTHPASADFRHRCLVQPNALRKLRLRLARLFKVCGEVCHAPTYA